MLHLVEICNCTYSWDTLILWPGHVSARLHICPIYWYWEI